MKIVILAGGGGTRLFPLSRTCFPKQFLKVEGAYSLLAQTVRRFLPLVRAEDIVIVTNAQYYYHVQNELGECGATGAHIVVEPAGRNTAPAIGLALKYCAEVLGCAEGEVVLVAPADHVIRPADAFAACVRRAAALATQGALVTFGVQPDKPETGYGYIEVGAPRGEGLSVQSFKEKPDEETALRYLAAGNYYWNSGMFVFTIGCMHQELAAHAPEIAQRLEMPYARVAELFAEMPDISIDYAVAERSRQVVMVPMDCYWNDIGSWDAMYEILPKDAAGNAMQGDCLALECHNSLLMGRDRLIAGIGLDDLLLVETDDVIVVAKKGESQKVKEVVTALKAQGRKEATEHTTLYRAWGSATVLGEGPRYRMKKIRVRPGGALTLQMHYHRSEHWIVINGTAKVTIGGKEVMVHENESVFIPQTTQHRLENPGRIWLEMIEVQNGSYVGEDDIERFD